MKRSIIPMLFATALLLTGCSKNENITTSTIYSENKIENRILTFANSIREVKNGIRSGGNSMYLNDAQWNIEAALNYYNVSESMAENIEMESRTVTIDINPVNDELTYDEITSIAFEMNEEINSDPNSKLLAADVFIVTKADNSFAIQMDAKFSRPRNIEEEFGDNDYWGFYNNSGYCDGPNEGVITTYGAPEILAQHVNIFAFGGWEERLSGYYFTDIEETNNLVTSVSGDFPNDQDDIANDNYLDYMLFTYYDDNVFDELPVDALCLNPEEMNFYSTIGIPSVIESLKPEGKDFLHVSEISAQSLGNINNNTESFFHGCRFRYGVKHIAMDSPGPLFD